MIAGRLHWTDQGREAARSQAPASRSTGAPARSTLTEAGSKRRASLHLVRGVDALAAHDPGGIEPLEASVADFARALRSANHTLKRALTDPATALAASATPTPTRSCTARGSRRSRSRRSSTTRRSRGSTTRRRRCCASGPSACAPKPASEFPEKVTAFRPEMAVHGRYREPCPVCGAPVQRIVHAENETNYCARCQTGGRLLADRALSRLLKADWPRTLEELEALRAR